MKSMLQVFSFDIVSKAMLGLATIALIRFMPEAQYATYTLALSLGGLILQGYVAAFNRIYIVSYEELGLRVADGAFLMLQLAGLVLLGLAGFPLFHVMGSAYLATAVLALAMCLSEYAKTRFQRDLHFLKFSFVDLARSSLFLGLVAALVLLVGARLRASYALIAQAVSMTVVFALAVHRHPPVRGAGLRRALVVLRRLFRSDDRYLFAYFVVLAVFSQVDIFVLKLTSNVRQLASYGAAFRYYALLALALGAVNTVLLPAIHRARQEGSIGDLVRRQQRLLLLFVPVVLAGAWASGWIIPILDGGRYPVAVGVFRLLSLSAILSFAFSPYANLVISYRAYRFLLTVVAAVLVLAVALDLVLVPRAGAVGAAAGHLVTFGLLNGACYVRARRPASPLAVAAIEAAS